MFLFFVLVPKAALVVVDKDLEVQMEPVLASYLSSGVVHTGPDVVLEVGCNQKTEVEGLLVEVAAAAGMIEQGVLENWEALVQCRNFL